MEIKERSNAGINDKNNVATATTVATIWTAQWFKFLALNRDATVPALSGRGIERYAIDECCHLLTLLSTNKIFIKTLMK